MNYDNRGFYWANEYPDTEQRKTNAYYVAYYLNQWGWSYRAICAVLGNAEQESKICPGVHQGLGDAFEHTGLGLGFLQWTPSTDLTDWLKKRGYSLDKYWDFDYQLEFLEYTFDEPYYYAGDQYYPTEAFPLKANEFRYNTTNDVAYLTEAFMLNYLRPGAPFLQSRIQYAQKWEAYFQGYDFSQPPGDGTAPPIDPDNPDPPDPDDPDNPITPTQLRRHFIPFYLKTRRKNIVVR